MSNGTTATRSLDERLSSFAEAWRPEKGDKLIGRIVDIDMRDSDYGDPYPVITVERDDGTEWAFHAFHTVARRELAKKRPQVGDRIGIAYFGKAEPSKPGMSGAELYKLVVERDDLPTAMDWEQVAVGGGPDGDALVGGAAEVERPSSQLGPTDELPF